MLFKNLLPRLTGVSLMTTGVVGMSSSAGAAASLSQISATSINTAPGVSLDNHRQQLVGRCVPRPSSPAH